MFRRRPILTVAAVGAVANANRRATKAEMEVQGMKTEQKMQNMINQNNAQLAQQQAAQGQQQAPQGQGAPPAPAGAAPYPGYPPQGQPPPAPPGYYYPQLGQAPPPPPPGYYYPPAPGQAPAPAPQPAPQYAPPPPQQAYPQYATAPPAPAPVAAPVLLSPAPAPQTPPAAMPVAAVPVAAAVAVAAAPPPVAAPPAAEASLISFDSAPASAQVAQPAEEETSKGEGIVFYTHPLAFNPSKVAIMLAEKQLHFDQVNVDILTGENLDPKYMKINPTGQVPTLVVNGTPITESLRICEYLDTIDNKPLGGNTVDRAFIADFAKAIDKWNAMLWSFGHSTPELLDKLMEIDIYRKNIASKKAREHPDMRAAYTSKIKTMGVNLDNALDPDEVATQDKYLDTLLDRAEQRLKVPSSLYLAGPEFSMVDACFAPVLFRIQNLGLEDKLIKPRSFLATYFTRIAARDSYQEAFMDAPDTWGGGSVLKRAMLRIKARGG